MKRTFQTLVIGASMAVGVSAIATNPAQAVTFSFNNLNETNTYTGGSNGTFIKANATAAVKALTDKDASSNVELWYSTENPTSNVGFTATQGKYSATVSSVTANDWNNFGSQWLGDLLNSYKPFQTVWNGFSAQSKSLLTSYFPSLGMGDPNIGGFQFGKNGGVELQLVGHLDVKDKLYSTLDSQITEKWKLITSTLTLAQQKAMGDKPTLQTIDALLLKANSSQKTLLTTLKDLVNLQSAVEAYKGSIAASEIAKVVTGGQTYYAYSFNSTASGITASDDGVSYSAIYTWQTKGYRSTPEPSVVLGMLGIAGIFATQRKLKKISG
ncbi:NF038130 family PEP-CTERM protein [Nostoc sp. FACHB-110]|uniref:NF038130 family PEP-CTERM protein n=1 Tax=Nostoc sp. FACHB-110 TaxID=2692834 RepID=UPI001688A21A|nr:NF038130 family PEP-CTERM protein [Nostoc sp. FACHB-110]MBD2437840.1 NF038130 family PEP-CTERM protein [Nostoc sp. FACHB-110]